MNHIKRLTRLLLIFIIFFTLSSCTKTEIDNNTKIKDYDGHTFDVGVILNFATSETPAVVSFKCTEDNCTLTKNVNISLTKNHTHKYIFICTNNSEYIAEDATCTSVGKYYKTCICGEHSNESVSYGDYKEHEYTNRIENDKTFKESATCTHGSIYFFSCSCGAVSQDLTYALDDILEHTYTEKIENESTLKSESTCLHGSIYYYSCSCGEVSDSLTYTKDDILDHDFKEKVSVDATLKEEATCTHGSIYYYSCECGEISSDLTYELDDKTEHSYIVKNSTSDALKEEATCTHGSIYYYSCSCGKISDTLTYTDNDLKEHTFNQKIENESTYKEATTCSHGSIYYYSCSCGEISDTLTYELDDKLEHTFTLMVVNDNALKSKANCVSKAIYYYSCSCGAISDTLTFEYGDVGTHDYVHYDLDENLIEHFECSACKKYFDLDKKEVNREALVDEVLSLFYSYNNIINNLDLDEYIYTFDGGMGMNDIKNYIRDITPEYETEFEIQNGTLVYIGSAYLAKATLANILIGDEQDLEEKALVNTAYSYYYQGNEIQYDMYTNRRSINISPEDASENNTVYLDCSSFVNSVYYTAYGKNILAGRKSNGESNETPSTSSFDTVLSSSTLSSRYGLVKYYDLSKYNINDETSITSALNEAKSLLQVGDLINYRHGSAGHVMMYIGDDKFIHCTGSSYALQTSTKNFPNCIVNPFIIPDSATTIEKNNGAIQISDSSELFSSSGSRYLFEVEDSAFVNSCFAIMRPLDRTYSSGSSVFTTLTSYALNRLSLPNVEIEKSSSIYNYRTVNSNDSITYTITLTNNNNYDIKYVDINDQIPNYCSFKSNDGNRPYVIDKLTNTIYFENLIIPASSSTTVSYTVTVNNNLDPGTLIESNNGYVNGVKLNSITNIVSGLSDTELSSLESTLKRKDIGSNENEVEYVNSLYSETIFDNTSLSYIFEDLYKYDTETGLYSINTSSNYYKYLVPTLYNGLVMKTDEYDFYINDRTRLVKYSYLEAGDIILTCTPESSSSTPTYVYSMYIYVNSSKIIKVSGTVITDFTTSLGTKNSSSKTFDNTTYQFLERLTGCQRYMILRPSIGL